MSQGHTYFDIPNQIPQSNEQDPLVQLQEVFGSDVTVVNAARVSFAKEIQAMDPKDAKLLTYLAKHNHVSPFFHPQIRFRFKMPIFVAREWFRHQIGLSRNEVSRRYVDSKVECWIPDVADLRERDPKLKQGSKDTPVKGAESVHAQIKEATDAGINTYESLLASGIAPEIARIILPQSMYTEFIETGSLYAYARICALRLDPTAQKEIRTYATKVDALLAKAFPYAWAALRVQFTPAPVVPVAPVAPAVPVEQNKNIVFPTLDFVI